jgi:hypothetical protein
MPEGIFTVPESGFCHAGKRFRIIVCHEDLTASWAALRSDGMKEPSSAARGTGDAAVDEGVWERDDGRSGRSGAGARLTRSCTELAPGGNCPMRY